VHNHFLRLPQISDLTGVKRHTLNARLKTHIPENEIQRTASNQITLTPGQVRSVIKQELSNEWGKIIYVGNLKGGVGKTTLVYMLSEVLSSFGLKTCAVDLDVQANLTVQFMTPDTNILVFLDMIENKVNISDLPVQINSFLDIIPSSLRNSLIQKALAMQSPKHLLSWFNNLCLDYLRNSYDVVIVDTPPSLNTLNSVFCLSLSKKDSILIPVAPEEFSIIGVQMFLDDVTEIRESYAQPNDINIKVLMNRFFQTQKSNLEILVKMTEQYGNFFF
jgi:chromosome partitioning protein